MASDALFAKVRERVKEYNLTEQEVQAIDTARQQLSSHSKRRKFSPIQTLALAGGGFLLGSQMGMISGAVAGAKTIKALPNPQRLIDLVRDVQKEVIMAKGHRADGAPRIAPPPVAPHQQQQQQQQQQQIGEFAADDTIVSHDYANLDSGFESEQGSNDTNQSIRENTAGLSYYQQQQQQQQQQPQPSAWDKIRAETLPNNSWTKLRTEAQANRDDGSRIEQSRAETAKRLRERESNVEELPRTREELEQRGTARKNQWGDLI
ncbi:hypothetical protein DFQ30_009579 [Apophysomyces sp. BC1015]|nr:hypothetical protein DFQ30_009579 [Apophysomyces sp. BC1015]KAG0183275.1 hypothetical protein DFQ29_007821 [Apophysomyces sp. BC1021]